VYERERYIYPTELRDSCLLYGTGQAVRDAERRKSSYGKKKERQRSTIYRIQATGGRPAYQTVSPLRDSPVFLPIRVNFLEPVISLCTGISLSVTSGKWRL